MTRRPPHLKAIAKRSEQDRIARSRAEAERFAGTLEGARFAADCRWFSERCRAELDELQAAQAAAKDEG